MLVAGDTLNEHGGRTWKVLGIEADVVYVELVAVPFWDYPENIGYCDLILISDVNMEP